MQSQCNHNAMAVTILCLLVFNANNNEHIILLLFILKGEIINYELNLLSILFKFFEYQGVPPLQVIFFEKIPLRYPGKCPHRASKIQNFLAGDAPITTYIGDWSLLKP